MLRKDIIMDVLYVFFVSQILKYYFVANSQSGGKVFDAHLNPKLTAELSGVF
jgi:hypothetical protein